MKFSLSNAMIKQEHNIYLKVLDIQMTGNYLRTYWLLRTIILIPISVILIVEPQLNVCNTIIAIV